MRIIARGSAHLRRSVIAADGRIGPPEVVFAAAKEPDVHGNRLRRFIIPAGETTLLFSGLVRDDRLPDHRDAEALVTAVADLPDDVLGIARPISSARSRGGPSAA
jgi:hypothetical protein